MGLSYGPRVLKQPKAASSDSRNVITQEVSIFTAINPM